MDHVLCLHLNISAVHALVAQCIEVEKVLLKMSDTWAFMVTELRRHPQLCYKSDIIAISGKILKNKILKYFIKLCL